MADRTSRNGALRSGPRLGLCHGRGNPDSDHGLEASRRGIHQLGAVNFVDGNHEGIPGSPDDGANGWRNGADTSFKTLNRETRR
ncbi:hypothetical protein D9M71_409740 [compost metagenome]